MSPLKHTKKQHYVWGAYLKSWTINDQISCLLKREKIVLNSIEGVANRRFFYQSQELTPDDINFLEMLIISQTPEYRKNDVRSWINTSNYSFEILKHFEASGISDQPIKDLREWSEKNVHERIHGVIEQGAVEYLTSLRAEQVDFLLNDEKKFDFLFFLSLQYFRTNRIRSRVLRNVENFRSVLGKQGLKNIEFAKLWNVMTLMFATNLAFELMNRHTKFVYLKNTSAVPFITGDQPVVNIKATGIPDGEMPKELELYYPITPSSAILIAINESLTDGYQFVDAKQVTDYNLHIVENSEEQIYSHSAKILEQFLKS